ncbi:MAG TPA: polysaccharide biosynthesis/export family protein [Hanamia sp.]|nr:polysaccharide biosynthesis/export family protein [Hanamia sp.]
MQKAKSTKTREESSEMPMAGVEVAGSEIKVTRNGIHDSPVLVRHSELTNDYSSLTNHHSPFTIHYSLLALLLFLIVFSSCTSTKNTIYFKDIQKDTTLTNLVSKNFEPKIQKGDLLSITVASLSPENTVLYNAPQNAQGPLTGYLVDENGDIQFIKLGTLHVAGMTRKELKMKLEKDLSPYLAQTVVAVGFLNRHVTMMGAVSSQVLPMPNDNMTIFDALAAGGGITEKGKADNVLVIREKDNSKEFKRLDLTDKSIFYSPYFYLQPNDIIYVEPVKVKSDNTTRIISYVTAGISFVLLVIDRIIK